MVTMWSRPLLASTLRTFEEITAAWGRGAPRFVYASGCMLVLLLVPLAVYWCVYALVAGSLLGVMAVVLVAQGVSAAVELAVEVPYRALRAVNR
jgi:hypothetical protein